MTQTAGDGTRDKPSHRNCRDCRRRDYEAYTTQLRQSRFNVDQVEDVGEIISLAEFYGLLQSALHGYSAYLAMLAWLIQVCGNGRIALGSNPNRESLP